jgi:pimeloyl-ACP methyl ester carboxylesterase
MGYPIIIHDYRGHFKSKSDFPLKSLTFVNMSKDVNSILEKCQIDTAIHIGHSMGVNVAIEFARNFPEKTKALTLISGNVLPITDIMFDSNIMDMAIPRIKSLLAKFPKLTDSLWSTLGKNPVALQIVKNGGFNVEKVSDDYIYNYLENISKLSPAIFFQLFEQMKAHDVLMDLEKILCPTLIIGGDEDRIIPNYLQTVLAKRIPNSQTYILKNGSHVPQADFPDFINKRILKFIGR